MEAGPSEIHWNPEDAQRMYLASSVLHASSRILATCSSNGTFKIFDLRVVVAGGPPTRPESHPQGRSKYRCSLAALIVPGSGMGILSLDRNKCRHFQGRVERLSTPQLNWIPVRFPWFRYRFSAMPHQLNVRANSCSWRLAAGEAPLRCITTAWILFVQGILVEPLTPWFGGSDVPSDSR